MFCWAVVTDMSGGRDLISANTEFRASTVECLYALVDFVSALDAKFLTVVPTALGSKKVNVPAKAKGVKLAIEPQSRYDMYFLNRASQVLALADEIDGENVWVCFNTFHQAIEEQDLYAALEETGSHVFNFYLGDNNRLPPGQGSLDWKRIMEVLCKSNYTGGLTFDAIFPIDRTPVSPYLATGGQIETGEVDADPKLLELVGVVPSNAHYTQLLKQLAECNGPLTA